MVTHDGCQLNLTSTNCQSVIEELKRKLLCTSFYTAPYISQVEVAVDVNEFFLVKLP